MFGMHMGTFDLASVKVISGHLVHFFPLSNNSKKGSRKSKQSMHMEYLTLNM